ncbi:MAG: NUDIX hydrolase [Candidatus Paceibacterota bacterium]|jgi:ADP-ribose pyrophosphatase
MKNYPKINIGIGGVILRGKSKILLTKRKTDPSVWTIPSGYMEKDENIFETIIREAKEETNIVIKPRGVVGVRQRITEKEGNNFWILTIADYKSGKVTPDNSEILETQFIPLSKALQEKITPVTKYILKMLLKNKLQILLPQKSLDQKQYRLFS